MVDEQAAPTPDEEEAVAVVDADGNVVEEGDPNAARILRGPDAKAVLKPQDAAAEPSAADSAKASTPSEAKAKKAPPEDKGA